MAKQWEVKQNDKVLGPFTDSQLTKLVATGRVNRRTPIRADVNSIWIVAERIPGLFSDEETTNSQTNPTTPQIEPKQNEECVTPEDTEEVWYVGREGKTFGPFSIKQLSERSLTKWLRPQDLLWKPGRTDWAPASTIAELFLMNSKSTLVRRNTSFRCSTLSAAEFRYPGETLSLIAALSLLFVGVVVVAHVTLGIILVIIAIWLVIAKFTEAKYLAGCDEISRSEESRLYDLTKVAAERLPTDMPRIYVERDRTFNAFAIGFHGRSNVVIKSGLLDVLNPDEILFVMWHAIAHLKCGHTRLWIFSRPDHIGNPIIQLFAHLLFKSWSRKCEFSCDRGGLLACQNPMAAASALAKNELGPGRANEENVNKLLRNIEQSPDSAADVFSELLSTHPNTMSRIDAVFQFSHSATFRRHCNTE